MNKKFKMWRILRWEAVLYVSYVFLATANATFNVFVSRSEVKRLLGLNAELRYVNNGTVNDYALSFVVMIPDHIWDLYFTWQNLRPHPVPYSMSFTLSNPEAMTVPQINIPKKGNIPTSEEVFRVVFECTGKVSAEVEMCMNMNFTLPPPYPNTTHLELKRKKICYKNNNTASDTMMIDAMVATASTFYIGVGCACVALLLISTVIFVFYMRTVKARRSDIIHYGGSSRALSTSTQGHTFLRPDTPNNNSSVNSYASLKRLTPVTTTSTSIQVSEQQKHFSDHINEVWIDRRNIVLQEKIQEGTFGQIYHAIVRDDTMITSHGLHVFVKTVTNQASSIQVSLLTAEGMMMLGMTSKFLLPLIGLCTDDPHRPMLLYPYMNHGNLKKFLQHCSMAAEGHCYYALITRDLVDMALQIVKGIAYLHDKRIIHRDIATRNCFVDEYLQVRLADNALARDLFPHDYHCLGDNENRPIKWLALESLLKKEFSYATDVWAFGVTMWELITLGQQPYSRVDPAEMHSSLLDGYRLDQPKNCPDDLFTVMSCCWSTVPEERPSVPYLRKYLSELHSALGSFI